MWSVPNKSKPGTFRNTTIRDARNLNLLPSPTTVLRLLHRHALVEWQIEQAILACVSTPRKIINGLEEPLDDFIHRVMHLEEIQNEERDAAAEKGRAIHKAIQAALKSESDDRPGYDNEFAPFVLPVLKDLGRLGRCVATEKIIMNSEYGYCGMTDCLLENPEEIIVADFKTTRKIPDKPYDEAVLQVSAYCGGLGNTGNKRIRGALVYVSTTNPGEIKVVECENWPADYRRFRLLLEFFKLTSGLI